MNYRIITILSDLSSVSLHKIPLDLYNEIYDYLSSRYKYVWNFQALYDNKCKDDVDQDKQMNIFYDKIEECEVIDTMIIQVY